MNKLLSLFALFFFSFTAVNAKDAQLSASLNTHSQQYFIENKGQWHADILYKAQLGGLNALITKKGILYDFFELKEVPLEKVEPFSSSKSGKKPQLPEMEVFGHVIEIILQGRNENAKAIGKEKSKTYHNYLTSGDPSHSKGYVGLYKEVAISSVYDNIDMRYYFEDNSLRYDYILKPGADVRKIKMQLDGSEHSYINEAGEWIFETRFGEVKNTKLLSYQMIDGEKKVIPCKFKKDADGNIVFDLGAYDHTKDLVIDPLVYSTFIGSGVPDYGTAIVVDDSNQAYITGHYYSMAAGNSYLNAGQYNYFGFAAWNIVVLKLSSDGSSLLFATFISSVNGANMAHDIHLRFDKTIHIVGELYTLTTDPGFYGILTPNGDSVLLNWPIYGNYGDHPMRSVKTDSQKNVYFTGDCWYPSQPFFPPVGYPPGGPFPPISDTFFYVPPPSGRAVLVAKLDSNLNLVGSSLFGAFGSRGNSIEVDAAGNMYVVGSIRNGSPSLMYPSSFDSTFNGGSTDAFLAIFNPNCVLLNLSFIGGDSSDKATSVKLDQQGNIYVLGNTASPDFPTTPGCFADSLKGPSDVFIAKFDPSGTNLLYSTFFGGIGKEESTEIQIDSMGNMIFGGFSDSIDLPVTIGCFDDTYNGLGDMFVTKLKASGDSLLYSTYIGGSHAELSYSYYYLGQGATPGWAQCGGLAIDKSGDIYITGSTDNECLPYPCNNLYPTTLGSYEPLPLYEADIFVSKIKPSNICDIDITISTSPYSNFLTQSQTYIRTSGTVIIDSGSHVKFDAEPTSYVQMNPGFLAKTTSVFVAQAFNGCSAGAPQLKATKNENNGSMSTLSDGIFVYPNPTTGHITIEFPPELKKVGLFDMMGQKVMEIDLSNAKSQYDLDIGRLANGVYILTAKGYTNIKIIKN
ncbi:MAG: T9SS type A sorting domain-containing protein [Bacteroidetes bacterium]|nr:T9SS type A sorting domain-containing protein [Bacteroidota bacterium]